MNIRKLEEILKIAQERLDKAVEAVSKKHKGGEMEEWFAASHAVLKAERELASERNEEHAIPIDFPLKWDVGAPCPHLLINDYKAFLAFYLRISDPNWDGTDVHIRNIKKDCQPIALVEFDHCISACLGSPNDEVFEGHRLNRKGLEGYTAQKVVNSKWLLEIETINKIHHCYNPETWKKFSHFIFWFHENTFECIAASYNYEVLEVTMPKVLEIICKRLI